MQVFPNKRYGISCDHYIIIQRIIVLFLFSSFSISIAGEEVQAGSLQVTIKLIIYGIEITVATDSYDLCGPEIGLKCPLKAGIVKINFKEEVHSSIPSVS